MFCALIEKVGIIESIVRELTAEVARSRLSRDAADVVAHEADKGREVDVMNIQLEVCKIADELRDTETPTAGIKDAELDRMTPENGVVSQAKGAEELEDVEITTAMVEEAEMGKEA